ncbi:hypothetical protein J7T55_015259 [Diaporthe amygdali]|uniref:uncharacterized protein n=1 Tax=Phomopsis amygdali TaxID=1214568 RepID=UPI0022FF288C|nr:uncharacterized protein J7T55_015259 [Diaporthe amygdali]KAJ0120530.1 hypothetical protein J7T55_015259 [Diaporthe amygdali]
MSSTKLEWFIAEGDNFNWSTQPFATTMKSMIDTGLHEWGFVIYRCVYGDDEAWQRYMKYFEEDIIEGLEHHGGDVVLPQYARWTVIEDQETLDSASIDTVRDMFVEWRNKHQVELEERWINRIIPPLLRDAPNRLPRFTYCLYVDQKCLNTVTAFAEKFPKPSFLAPIPPPLVAVLVDSDFNESLYVGGGYRAAPDERGQFPAIDGRTCKYIGWAYVDVNGLGSWYDELHRLRLDDAMSYRRPPKIMPLGFEALTDNGIQRV